LPTNARAAAEVSATWPTSRPAATGVCAASSATVSINADYSQMNTTRVAVRLSIHRLSGWPDVAGALTMNVHRA
jgi:hypothetical protein